MNFDRRAVVDAGLRHFVALAGIAALAAYVWLYARPGADIPIHSDGFSYYVYAPSWLVYRDGSLEAYARDWFGGQYPAFTGIVRWPATGRLLNYHPIGPAILMLPFVAAGHLLTRWSNLPVDGFSLYYQHAAGLAGVAYLLAGLAVLRRTLTRHFSSATALATLTSITWGTNLFHYGVSDSTFSHVYSFFLISSLVDLTDLWWSEPTRTRTACLGLTSALIVLARQPDAVYLLILPLYGVRGWSDLRNQVSRLWARRGALSLMTLIGVAGLWPQLAIYKQATSHWFVSSYAAVGGSFTFGAPHFFGVLFSSQKGLFFWSPVLLLAVGGMFLSRGWSRSLLVPAAITLGVHTWLIASWFDWQFGASFGHRGFTDALGLFAIFMAVFFRWAAERRKVLRVVRVATVMAVLLSTVQMLQYWSGILPNANTTWDQYRQIFLHFQ